VTVPPALLDLEASGLYMGGLSAWTVREYITAGLLRPVPLPSPSGKPLRRIVLAREDLDALVARWRSRPLGSERA
jgi:DNA-binding transcriptional LysR family regulator